MILKRLGPHERDLYFDHSTWVAHPIQKNYSLSLELGPVKVGQRLQFTLYILQRQKYVYHSEGSNIRFQISDFRFQI